MVVLIIIIVSSRIAVVGVSTAITSASGGHVIIRVIIVGGWVCFGRTVASVVFSRRDDVAFDCIPVVGICAIIGPLVVA